MSNPIPNKLSWLVLATIIIFVPFGYAYAEDSANKLPEWIRNNFVWYAEGKISEMELLNSIQFMVENNIITLENKNLRKDNAFQDRGDFYPVYEAVSNPKLEYWKNGLEGAKVLETIADKSNPKYKLPHDVAVVFSECGMANAFYDPDGKKLVLCYELVEYYAKVFTFLGYEPAEASKRTVEVFAFVTLHELGHVLVDVYDLPITGMEEDAVDQLASLILSDNKEFGLSALESTAIWFAFEGTNESTSQLPLWDEHSLSQQRFYNVLCWMYGSSPEKYSGLVEDDLLPRERSVKCTSEYEKISQSWDVLLSPYLKKQTL